MMRRRLGRAVVAAALVAGFAHGAPAPARHPAGAAADTAAFRDGYRLALPPYAFRFPRDHAAHREYRTEWWYYTGQLAGPGVAYGYEITFFRVGLDTAWRSSRSAWAPREIVFAHVALTDLRARSFRYDERIARPALGLAGADTARCHVWLDDWSAALDPDGRTFRLRATLAAEDREPRRAPAVLFDLALTSRKPPAIHGAGGVSRKSPARGDASHYYSLTRLATRGRVTIGGHAHDVSGESWMDHEFGTTALARGQAGWDWFGLELDDGRELMLYRLRLRNGGTEPLSSGTLVAQDGTTRHLALADFAIEPGATWTSPHTGAHYPARWHVRVPAEGLELDVVPRVADQELRTATAGLAYWEGAVAVAGTARGHPLHGRGYVELTGYAEHGGRP